MRRRQSGFGALEVLVCLIVGTLAMAAAVPIFQRYAENQMRRVAAQQMDQVSDAAGKYIKDNFASVASAATPTTTAVITTAMLRNTGYLPSGFSDLNAYGQSYLVLALEPSANTLQTLIVTQGGEAISEMSVIEAARLMGARGGFVSKKSTGIATGSLGGWQVTLATYGVAPGAGHLASALFFDNGALVADFLYRNAVAGHPEVNRMNTAINMNNNDLNNTNVATANTVNTVNANVSGNANVAGNTDTNGETYTGNWFRTKGDGGWYSEKHGGGFYMTDPTWVRVYNDKNLSTGGTISGGAVASSSSIYAAGRIQTDEFVHFNGKASIGGGCSPNGLEGSDASGSGAAVRCVNGQWQKMGGLSSVSVATCTSATGTFNATCVASCPVGTMVTGGGCTGNNEWEVNNSQPYGNGWLCTGSEDYGSGYYYQVVNGYAMCAN